MNTVGKLQQLTSRLRVLNTLVQTRCKNKFICYDYWPIVCLDVQNRFVFFIYLYCYYRYHDTSWTVSSWTDTSWTASSWFFQYWLHSANFSGPGTDCPGSVGLGTDGPGSVIYSHYYHNASTALVTSKLIFLTTGRVGKKLY